MVKIWNNLDFFSKIKFHEIYIFFPNKWVKIQEILFNWSKKSKSFPKFFISRRIFISKYKYLGSFFKHFIFVLEIFFVKSAFSSGQIIIRFYSSVFRYGSRTEGQSGGRRSIRRRVQEGRRTTLILRAVVANQFHLKS